MEVEKLVPRRKKTETENVIGAAEGSAGNPLVMRNGLYGSTVTSTNAGNESAPFLSVTRSLNR